ncbi:hypothetical protein CHINAEXTREME_11790 [Halobiforma lacisalsi AJ5]|uniref:Uncharacterized protein n=1 Tax=Natronobacterium lacisalsi AJ5 TaxID=358396 RepID=M0LC02_NATLA|nr:hypothetical protein [Halobiforma lacisalsi]APW98422.1 hypothetical protein CHINAEXTREME_11790 [Halobiforma lacisalsi AJ5]EMA31106.1 hypothetical protein C445_15121 [Halobiforma lacisalsi AJ5]
MSNPFDDLESGTESGNDEDSSASGKSGRRSTESTTQETTTSTLSTSDEGATGESEASADPAETGPAFEYSEVRQKPLYAKDEEWAQFEKNVRTTIGPRLAQADVVDEATREIHNAVLKLANEQPDRVAELLLEERRSQ